MSLKPVDTQAQVLPPPTHNAGLYSGPAFAGDWGNISVTPTATNMIHNNLSQFGGKIIYNVQERHSDFKIIDWSQFIPGKNNIKDLIDVDKYYYPIIKKEYGKIAQPIWNYHRFYDINRYPDIFKQFSQSHFISVYDLRNKRIIDK